MNIHSFSPFCFIHLVCGELLENLKVSEIQHDEGKLCTVFYP